jgi:hypothetical protein
LRWKALTRAVTALSPSREQSGAQLDDLQSFLPIHSPGARRRKRVTRSAPRISQCKNPIFGSGRLQFRGDPAKRSALEDWQRQRLWYVGFTADMPVLPPEKKWPAVALPRASARCMDGASRTVHRWDATRPARARRLDCLFAQAGRRWGDIGHRGSSVEGRACTLLFHAETTRSRA